MSLGFFIILFTIVEVEKQFFRLFPEFKTILFCFAVVGFISECNSHALDRKIGSNTFKASRKFSMKPFMSNENTLNIIKIDSDIFHSNCFRFSGDSTREFNGRTLGSAMQRTGKIDGVGGGKLHSYVEQQEKRDPQLHLQLFQSQRSLC